MKPVVSVIILLALTVSVFGRRVFWPPKERPPVSLVAAVEAATKELNKDGANYYCLGANLAKTFSDCDWELRFHNAEGQGRIVSVGSDQKVRISESGFDY